MDDFLCGCCLRGGCAIDKDGDMGEPIKYDPHFEGPINSKARRPKDILCLIIFFLCIICLVSVGLYALIQGEPRRILYPTDSKGRLCGVHEDVKHQPFLFFFDLVKCAQVAPVNELITGDFDITEHFTCPTPQVCISECPVANEFGIRDNPICVDSVDTTPFINLSGIDFTNITAVTASSKNVATLLELIRTEQCAPYYIESTAVAHRCLPTLDDLSTQVDIMMLNSSTNFQALANISNDFSSMDLFLNVDVQSIVNGELYERLFTATIKFLEIIYQDFITAWPGLLIGIFLSFAVSLIYITLIRWFVRLVIAVGIGLALSFIAAITIFGFYQYFCFQEVDFLFSNIGVTINNTVLDFIDVNAIKESAQRICSNTAILREFVNKQLPWFKYQENTWLAVGIVGTLLLFGLVTLLIAMSKRISFSIWIIKEANKAVKGIQTSVLYPLITCVLLMTTLIYWALVAISLYTVSEPTYAVIMNGSVMEEPNITEYNVGLVTNGTSCDPLVFTATVFRDNPFTDYNTTISCQFKEFSSSSFMWALQVYHLFGLVWLTKFILALGECTLAGGFASWYWTFNKSKDVPTFTLSKSFLRALLFHSGSLAFGSLLLAIPQIFSLWLGYIKTELNRHPGKVARGLLCLLGAFFWCYDRILRYMTCLAYVEIAVNGHDFCTSSCNVIKLLHRNMEIYSRTAFKHRIVDFLLLFGSLAITGVISILAYLGFSEYFSGLKSLPQPLNFYLGPVILLTVTSFLIASGFMSVYSMAVNTILICALEDLERNDGLERPYYMSKQLRILFIVMKEEEEKQNAEELQQYESLEPIQSNTPEEDSESNNKLKVPFLMSEQLSSLSTGKSISYERTPEVSIYSQFSEGKQSTEELQQLEPLKPIRSMTPVESPKSDIELETPFLTSKLVESPSTVSSKGKQSTEELQQLESLKPIRSTTPLKSLKSDNELETPMHMSKLLGSPSPVSSKGEQSTEQLQQLESLKPIRSTMPSLESDNELETPMHTSKLLESPSTVSSKEKQSIEELQKLE